MNYRTGLVYACFGVSALVAGCTAVQQSTAVHGSNPAPSSLVRNDSAPRAAQEETGPGVVRAAATADGANAPVAAAKTPAIPDVPTQLTPLDLSRPPTVNELMAAGQLGGQLFPTHTVADPEREASINLSFGIAIQEWNKHAYRQAVELFKEHIAQYPDSPWVAEAKLHMGCDAQYTGRYSEAEQLFNTILADAKANSSEGMQRMVNKAILRLGVLKAFQNNFAGAEKMFTTLMETSDNWRDRTYASHWLQRLSSYNADKVALLNCGTLALAHLLEKRGDQEQAREISEILPVSLSGQSLQDLKEIASRFGYGFTGYRVSPEALATIPLPAIVQIQGQNPGDSGHYWVLEKAANGRVELYDAQAGRYFDQDVADFSREWTGNVLVFEQGATRVARGERLSDRELSQTYGGCCGVPRPPSNLGKPRPKHPKNPCGAPSWSVNPVNMNLFVEDIPLWFSSPIGPPVQIGISYNSQSSIAYSEPFGSKWQFNYGSYLVVDTGGQVTVFMPDGAHDIYSPDGSGGYLRPSGVFNTLSKVAENHFTLTFADGTVYEYNIPAGTGSLQPFLVKISDANSQSLTFGYDANVRLVTITDAIGRITNLTYNAEGRVTTVTDPFGRAAIFGYSGTTLTSITDMGGYVSNLTYDSSVYLASIGNSRGTWQFYIEPSSSTSNGSNAFPPPGGAMWANYRITITDPEGNSELHMYNGYSNYGWYVSPNFFAPYVSSSNNSFVNSDVKRTKYNYTTVNGVGTVSTTTFPDGSKETYSYDSATGLRNSVTDAHGHKTSYLFNSEGSIVSMTAPNTVTTTMTYATNGVDLTGVVDAAGSLAVTYDTHHKITSRTDRLGNVTSYTYNSFGQVATSTDPLGNITTYTYYDASHASKYRLKQVTLGGKVIEAYSYDTVGRVLSRTDATGLALAFGYDSLDRVTTITWPDGKSEQFVYSGCCPRLIDSYTDRAGKTTTFTFDALQRLTEIHNPDGTLVRYTYDRNGNLIKLIDANGNATSFAYDASDRLVSKTHSDGKTEAFTYDGAGLLTERTGGRGIRTSFTYDANHNITNLAYSDGTPAVSYVYDNADRVITRGDGAGTFAYTYDANSRLTAIDGPWSADTVTLTHDSLGRSTGLQLQGAEAVGYSYDALSRLTAIAVGTRQFTYSYPSTIASPFALSFTRPNGAVTSYSTDILNRLTGTSTSTSNNVVLAANSFPYNASDERVSETVTNGPASAALTDNLVTYDYNHVNQIVSSTNPTRLYTFDADGNMTGGYTAGGYQFVAAYDAENRLKRVDYTDNAAVAHRIDYYYSGDNFLARQVADGVETRFVRFAGLTLQERNAGNTAIRSFAWNPRKSGGLSGLLEINQGGNRYYPVYDGKGNVRNVIDSLQTSVASYSYDPFGLPLTKSGSVQQPYRFSTKEYDEATGLSYFGYRFYSPALQRWLTRDPLGVRGGFNLYGFVENNPNRFTDPWGLDPGDPFSSADEAGRDAIQYINDKSISENREYGGYVYKNDDGTYTYTNPNPGTLDSTQLGPKPGSGTVVGDYHTHGAYDPRYDNEHFSPQDKVGYSGDYRYGYLGTPNKTFQRYDSKTGTITPCK